MTDRPGVSPLSRRPAARPQEPVRARDSAPEQVRGTVVTNGTLKVAQTLFPRAQLARREGVMRYEPTPAELSQLQAMFPHAQVGEALRRVDAALDLLGTQVPIEMVMASAEERADCWELNGIVIPKPVKIGEYIEVRAMIDGRIGLEPAFRLRVMEARTPR